MSIFKKIESYHEKTIFCEIMGKLNRLSHNNKADRHKLRAPSNQRRTDRPTDRQTD